MAYRLEEEKKKFTELLNKNPLVSLACEKMGVSRATYYRWRETDENFLKESEIAIDNGREKLKDFGESKLIEKLNAGDNWAIRFYLENNHERYYKKKPSDPNAKKMTFVDFIKLLYKHEENSKDKE